MGATWEFVASNPDGADAEAKRTVRKAAMRAFRRNQRMERMQQFKKKDTTSSPESDKSSSSSSHADEGKAVKRVKVEQGLSARPAVVKTCSLEVRNGGLQTPVLNTPMEYSGDYWSNRQELSPRTPLSNGIELAMGFSSPVGCGGPSNYQLLNHCEYFHFSPPT